MTPPPPTSTLFPYTTLFRSISALCASGRLPSMARGRPTFSSTERSASRLKNWKTRSEEHTSELQSQSNLVCRLLLEKKKHVSSATQSRLTTLSRGEHILHCP